MSPEMNRARVLESSIVPVEKWELEFVDAPLVSSNRRAKLRWRGDGVKRVLLVKKWKDGEVTRVAVEIAAFMVSRGISVLVEEKADFPIDGIEALDKSQPVHKANVHLMVSIGGDGTLLHAARLFSRGIHPILPPCLVFSMGSLGFLSNFSIDAWRSVLDNVLTPGAHVLVTLRTRLRCNIGEDVRHVLNECTVSCRAADRRLGKLSLKVDGEVATLIEGDGVIISTPTGSTGYNMSCGGPMVSPSVPATVICPIAPSSLSFRPIVISEASYVEIVSHVDVSEVLVDGRLFANLSKDESVCIRTSMFPMPVINSGPLDSDWFEGINSKLKWNARGATQRDHDY
ncbi:putative NAD kinase 2 [Diplonema papillatum]|nr:putative NAD kinase 2 [Diplonema papillatum]